MVLQKRLARPAPCGAAQQPASAAHRAAPCSRLGSRLASLMAPAPAWLSSCPSWPCLPLSAPPDWSRLCRRRPPAAGPPRRRARSPQPAFKGAGSRGHGCVLCMCMPRKHGSDTAALLPSSCAPGAMPCCPAGLPPRPPPPLLEAPALCRPLPPCVVRQGRAGQGGGGARGRAARGSTGHVVASPTKCSPPSRGRSNTGASARAAATHTHLAARASGCQPSALAAPTAAPCLSSSCIMLSGPRCGAEAQVQVC